MSTPRQGIERIERTDADIEIDRLFHFMAIATTQESRELWSQRHQAAISERDEARAQAARGSR